MDVQLKRGADEWSQRIGADFASSYQLWKQTHCQECFALLPANDGAHTCARNPTTVKNAIIQELLRVQRELMPDESIDTRYFALNSAVNGMTTRLLAKRTQHRVSAEKNKRAAEKIKRAEKKPKL